MTDKPFVFTVFLFLITITLVINISRRGEPVVVKSNLENLPMEIRGFKASEGVFPEAVYKELNADRHVFRYYKGPDDKRIELYIGYYGTAKGGRTGHNPYGCLPGGGWGIIKSEKEKVRPLKYLAPVNINYILAQKGETFLTVLHWYQSEGNKVLADGIQQNIQRFLGRVFHNRNDGAFVQLSYFTDEKGIAEANVLIKSFAETLLDLLPQYWPIER
jgi:EpsI family protein